jgi:hypothetical protein
MPINMGCNNGDEIFFLPLRSYQLGSRLPGVQTIESSLQSSTALAKGASITMYSGHSGYGLGMTWKRKVTVS